MVSPVEALSGLRVGTVDYVSAGEIRILLELDAPENTALNAGVPTRFPRINGYLLIPIEGGALVGLVTSISVERSAFPKRTGLRDFGLIDLPFPLRKLSLTPLGTLVTSISGADFKLERGVYSFPSVGDAVLLPTPEQSLAIVERGGSDRRIKIGTAPLANNAVVSVDPDKLFGRHLAVLGNTGSGKSCSVAGLIRWSLEESTQNLQNGLKNPNARFIILDPNGEYSDTFSDLNNTRLFQVEHGIDLFSSAESLKVPAWMWNSYEWSAFSAASGATQRPMLLQALRDLRSGARASESVETRLSRLLRSYRAELERYRAEGIATLGNFPGRNNVGNTLRNLSSDASAQVAEVGGLISGPLSTLAARTDQMAAQHAWQSTNNSGYNAFADVDIQNIVQAIDAVLVQLPVVQHAVQASEDAPIAFDVSDLPSHLDYLARESGAQIAQFLSTLTMRVRMMLADHRLSPIVNPSASIDLVTWLESYIGADQASNGQITIIDLSLVPSDVLHLTTAVISRLIFEALQRYRRLSSNELPTVLVLEEAHNFVRRGNSDAEGMTGAVNVCREVFERIAREGRKFGLGLVLSSQRPAELSPTVLAQCNTFLLHRIVNDRDQELVARLVPDSLGGLLRELPSLPARNAILLGWATSVPILVEMNELVDAHRPRSSDPDFWDVWTGAEERKVDWHGVANDWTS